MYALMIVSFILYICKAKGQAALYFKFWISTP